MNQSLVHLALLASSAAMRDTSIDRFEISGNIQIPMATMSPVEMVAESVTEIEAKYASEYFDCDFNRAEVDALMCKNQTYTQGSAVFDTGCQSALMGDQYESFMKRLVESRMNITGFDGSQLAASKHGCAAMYFLQPNSRIGTSSGQGVKDFKFDTVEGLSENLFACAEYYEQGADIHLVHDGFSGVIGRNPKTGQSFQIPAVYSYEQQAFLVHFIMANSVDEATRVGKVVQKSMQSDNVVNARFAHACEISDESLYTSILINNGACTMRDGEDYVDIDPRAWGKDDSDSKALLCQVCDIPPQLVDEICDGYEVNLCGDTSTCADMDVSAKNSLLCDKCISSACMYDAMDENAVFLAPSIMQDGMESPLGGEQVDAEQTKCLGGGIEPPSTRLGDIYHGQSLFEDNLSKFLKENTVMSSNDAVIKASLPFETITQDGCECEMCSLPSMASVVDDACGMLYVDLANGVEESQQEPHKTTQNRLAYSVTMFRGTNPESHGVGEREAGPDDVDVPDASLDADLGLDREDYLELIDDNYKELEAALSGMKEGLSYRDKKLTQLELHIQKGHIGYCPDCELCRSLKANQRRRYMVCDPHRVTQNGYKWGMDLISWKTTSLNGNNYTMVMRDYATGMFKLKHMAQRSQLTEAMRAAVTELRSDPRFKDSTGNRTYELVSFLKCDPAGEQSDLNKEFNAMCEEMGIKVEWSDPTDKRSDGFAESAVKAIELTCKAILAEQACPASWWEPCCDNAEDLRNHVPLSRNVRSEDGDAVTPIEELSDGKVSRRACHRFISHFVACGTPAMVTDANTSKASDNTRTGRHKPGIAYKMVGTLPMWKSPITGGLFRSKSYAKYKAPRGVSAWTFLGLKTPSPLPHFGLVEEKDEDVPRMVVEFDDIGRWHAKAKPRKMKAPAVKASGKMPYVTVVDTDGYIYEVDDESGEYRKTTGMIQKLQAAGVLEKIEDMSARDKSIFMLTHDPDSFVNKTVYQKFGDLGVYSGIVMNTDVDYQGKTLWRIMFSDGIPGDYYSHEMISYLIDRVDGTDETPRVVKKSRPMPAGAQGPEKLIEKPAEDGENDLAVKLSESTVASVPDEKGDGDTDGQYVTWRGQRILIDASVREERLDSLDDVDGLYHCENGDTFKSVCMAIGLDKSLWPRYYDFVHQEYMGGELFKNAKKYPGGSGFSNPFRKGVKRPSRFEKGLRFPIPAKDPRWSKIVEQMRAQSHDANEEHQLKALETQAFRAAAYIAKEMTQRVRAEDNMDDIMANIAMHALKAAGGEAPDYEDLMVAPRNFNEVMKREDYDVWLHAVAIELNGLRDRGVFSEELYTLKQLRAMGITRSPMPCGLLFERKQTPDGLLDKYKSRLVQRGTKHNMKRAFGADHIYETYSAAPDLPTNRIMQALMVLNGWSPVCFDICLAYLAAEIPDDERVPVEMDKGLREFDPVTGESLYPLLKGNLYGSPLASRRFVQCRDEFLLSRFNEDDGGWSCRRMIADKSMFRFTSPEGRIVIACIHSDDVDCVCEDVMDGMFIAEEFNKRFSPKEGEPGIKMVDTRFQLGVERTLVKDEETGVTYIELTQRACVEELYNEFKDELPEKHQETPVPPDCFLCTHHADGAKKETSQETIAHYEKRGYKHVIGTLLWLSRNCYPEISQGLHLLCRVMAMPDKEAWDAAMHMVSYCRGQMDRGIRFRSDGNIQPVCAYDSSHRPDPRDSKCIGGFVVMLAGGPVSWQSKKNLNTGTSSSDDEYQVAYFAARECKWVRDLLMELDLGEKMGHDFSQPIVLLGDNDQATRWAVHGMVTTANKSLRMNFHWVQEAVKDGIVCPRRVSTLDNTSDIFTKSLKEADIQRLRPGMTGYGELPPIPDAAPI